MDRIEQPKARSEPPCACGLRSVVFLILLTIATVVVLVGLNLSSRGARAPISSPPTTAPSIEDPALARGMVLYQKNCAACHGAAGQGDGLAAYLLYPKPRNFSQGTFRLTSNPAGLPTDDDVLRTLRRGMPGSAMPPFAHLPENDLRALILAVRALAVEGKAAQIMQASKSTKRDKAMQMAHTMLDPRPPIALPARPPDEKIELDRGKTIYANSCLACHGADGRGRDKRDLIDSSGYPIFARDFTLGIFKGGSSGEDIARRLLVGMPGSPMPASAQLSPEELWSLVAYVQTFIKPGAEARVEQSQRTITVNRINNPVTATFDSLAWEQVQTQTLPLMPLWWRDDRIEVVAVRAIHDGSQVAIELSWDDPTANDLTVMSQSFTDGAAIQLASAFDPPLFAMGDKDGAVDIWHWKASRQRDAAATQPVLAEAYPNMAQPDVGEGPDPVYQTATAAGNLVAQTDHPKTVESLQAQGFGTLSSRGPGAQLANGAATRTATGWRIVFIRELGAEEGVELAAGKAVSIAFAVWDGHAGDRNGQKSVTIWHQLALEP